MPFDLFEFANLTEQEAAVAGISSMEPLEYRESVDVDFVVSRFKNTVPIGTRTGHARFRRTPVQSHLQNPDSDKHLTLSLFSGASDSAADRGSQPFIVDFFKDKSEEMRKEGVILPEAAASTSGNSFASTITGEGSVSNGKSGSPSMLLSPPISAGKPPLSGKKCRGHDHSDSGKGSGSSGCHCKKRKCRAKRIIRVSANNSTGADIPSDEYSWRKYGQKPIKGSPYPRAYYKCSTVKGCPARKHVERANDDPTMLILTYEGDHRHTQVATAAEG